MGEYYDKYERDGDIHWQWYAKNTHRYKDLVNDAIRPFIGADLGSVIDVGCGDGLPLSLLNDLGFKCSGVDMNEEGIKLALEHGVSAEFFIQEAERFAGRKMKFDYLFSLNTIEHLMDPKAMVEIMKNIKEFGVIITDVKNPDGRSSVYHTHEFSPEEFEDLFADLHLTRIDISDPAYFGYIVKNK